MADLAYFVAVDRGRNRVVDAGSLVDWRAMVNWWLVLFLVVDLVWLGSLVGAMVLDD